MITLALFFPLVLSSADLMAARTIPAPPPVAPPATPASPEASPPPLPSPPPPPLALPAMAAPPGDGNAPIFYASIDRGVGVTTENRNFSLEVHFFTQIRLEEDIVKSATTPEFRIVMARPVLRGTLFRPWIQYFVQPELGGAATTLLDAEVTIQPWAEFGVKVGQFLTPFTHEFLVPPFRLLFPDFAPSNIFFRDGRDLGAMVMGQPAGGHFEYYAGVFNGNGINKLPGGARIMGIARIAANLRGKPIYTETPQFDDDRTQLSIGLNTTVGRQDLPLPDGAPAETVAEVAPYAKLGLDATLGTGPFSLQAEGYARWQRLAGGATQWAGGTYLQLGLFVYQRFLQLATRFDLIDVNVSTHAGLRTQAEGMLVFYARGNHLKLHLRYAYGNTRGADLATQASHLHALTLQGQLQL